MNWPYHYTPYIWPMLATFAFIWLLGLYSWRRCNVPGAIYFVWLCFLGCAWALFSALQLLSVDFATKFFWWRLELSIQSLAAPLTYCFAVAYAGLGRWLTRRNLALLVLPPLAYALLIYTNDLHHWMWSDVIAGEYLGAVYEPGIWAFIVYNFLLFFTSVGVLIWLFIRSPQYRWPVAVILAGQVTLRIVYLLGLSGSGPRWPVDPLILTFNVYSITNALALFRFRLFDVVPLARELVVERMSDGMVVVDAIGRIADLNPAAQALLHAPRKATIGREAREVLSSVSALQRLLDDPAITRTEIQAGAMSRWYEAHLSPLLDPRGFRLGQLLLLRDVTEQKQAQAVQLEQQRALAALKERERVARELHDELSQELAFISLQARAANDLLSDGDIQQAGALLARLAEVAREVQADVREQISGLSLTIFPEEGFVGALCRFIEAFNRTYGIQAELVLPDGQPAIALEPTAEVQLLRIVQEAFTNIRKHAGAQHARVSLAMNPGGIEMIVDDDGNGFDPQEQAGNGPTYGLHIMHERATEIGGAFQVSSAAGCGTRISVQIPAVLDWRRR